MTTLEMTPSTFNHKQINLRVLQHLDEHGDTTSLQDLAKLYGNPQSRDRSLAHIRRVVRWWRRHRSLVK
jgi:predicted metal-dependent HD superfamily phosphohydrolase